MDENIAVAKVNEVLRACAEVPDDLPIGLERVAMQRTWRKLTWPPTAYLRELVGVLDAAENLGIFDGVHRIGGATMTTSRTSQLFQVAGWLVRRAKEVGAERASNDLARYVSSSEVDMVNRLAFDGREVPAGETEFCEDITVSSFEGTTTYSYAVRLFVLP